MNIDLDKVAEYNGKFLFDCWDLFYNNIPQSLRINGIEKTVCENSSYTYKNELFKTFVTWLETARHNQPFYTISEVKNEETNEIEETSNTINASEALRISVLNNVRFKPTKLGLNIKREWLKPLIEYYNENIDKCHLIGVTEYAKIQ